MKKLFLTVFFITFLFINTTIAHPPGEVIAEFDLENHILSVKIVHDVGGENDSHYIKEVTINHNGEKVIPQKTSKQLTNTQTFVYFMPAVVIGDEIDVLAICNLHGDGTFKFTVEDKYMQNDPPGGQSEETAIQSTEVDQNLFAFRSSNIIGSAVQHPNGEQLGNIEDLIVDTRSGQTLFAILSFGGFLGIGEDLFAIPWESLTPKPASGIFILDVELERLQEAPAFSPDEWPAIGDREWGTGIYQHYGYPSQTYPGTGYGYSPQKYPDSNRSGYSPYSQSPQGGWGMNTPYGMMFNPETLETFETEVIRVDRFVPITGMTEGVELIVNLEGNPAPVHLGPSWYLENQDLDIQEGDTVEVTGSRTEMGELPGIIATKIVSPEGTLNLRNELGSPFWSEVPPMEVVLIEDKEVIVNIYEYLFYPGAIEVTPGTTVTWINRDLAVHTVTSGVTGDDNTGEVFDSPELQTGQEFSYTFEEMGGYPYFCRFHPSMTGRVIVSE